MKVSKSLEKRGSMTRGSIVGSVLKVLSAVCLLYETLIIMNELIKFILSVTNRF